MALTHKVKHTKVSFTSNGLRELGLKSKETSHLAIGLDLEEMIAHLTLITRDPTEDSLLLRSLISLQVDM